MSETGTWKIPKPGRSITIPFATLSILVTALTTGWAVVEKWKAHAEAEKKAAVEHDRKERAVLERLEKLERWKCVLGWDPGGIKGATSAAKMKEASTHNSERVCSVPQPEGQ